MALLQGGYGHPPQPIEGPPAKRARRPLHLEEVDSHRSDLGRFLDQPGDPLGPKGRDQQIETKRRLVGWGRVLKRDTGRIAVDSRHLAPARTATAVHDPNRSTYWKAPGTEEQA